MSFDFISYVSLDQLTDPLSPFAAPRWISRWCHLYVHHWRIPRCCQHPRCPNWRPLFRWSRLHVLLLPLDRFLRRIMERYSLGRQLGGIPRCRSSSYSMPRRFLQLALYVLVLSSSHLHLLTPLCHSTGNFVISRATPTMFLRMGNRGFGVYLFFATMQVLSIPFIVLLLPETRSVPLEAMDRLWAEKNTWRANSLLMAEASPSSNFDSLRNFRTDFFPMLQQLKQEHQGDSKIATTSSDQGSSSQDVEDQKESV